MIAALVTNVVLATALLAAEPVPKHQLICCGAEEVVIFPLVEKGLGKPVWRWRAVDSSLSEEAVRWFRSTDDCKPHRDTIIITSSNGGVALIERESKRCLFLAYAKNAHSACLLPENRLAVASSFGGDQLLIYSLKDATLKSDEAKAEKVTPAEPILSIPLVGAHGAVWDNSSEVLWALGSDVLLKLKIEPADRGIKLVTKRSWKLPSPGGHDLFPMNDGKHLSLRRTNMSIVFTKRLVSFVKIPSWAMNRK